MKLRHHVLFLVHLPARVLVLGTLEGQRSFEKACRCARSLNCYACIITVHVLVHKSIGRWGICHRMSMVCTITFLLISSRVHVCVPSLFLAVKLGCVHCVRRPSIGKHGNVSVCMVVTDSFSAPYIKHAFQTSESQYTFLLNC